MTARDQLAAAHARMTPAEIAEHALALAMVLESMDAANAVLASTVNDMASNANSIAIGFRNMQVALRMIASLNASRKFRPARNLAAEAAAVDLVLAASVPENAVKHVPIAEAWPEAFAPKGSLE